MAELAKRFHRDDIVQTLILHVYPKVLMFERGSMVLRVIGCSLPIRRTKYT